MPCNPVDSTRLYGFISQKIVLFIVVAVKASNSSVLNSFVVAGPVAQIRGLFCM
jgi:hypothetical protein